MNEQKVYYKRVRGFAEIFSATFGYIKQNFKSFFGSIILFTIPFLTTAVLLVDYIISNIKSGDTSFASGISMFEGMFAAFFIIVILILLMQTVYVTVINEHLIINEQLAPGEQVKTATIGSRFFDSFWRVLGNCMLLGIFGLIFLVLYAIVNSVITGIFSLAGTAGIMLAALIQLAFSFMVTPVMGYVFITSLFVVQRDKVGIITALGKVIKYLKNNFWRTWCVSVAGYLMTYISGGIAMIPAIVFIIIQVFSRVKYNPSENMEISMTTIIIASALFLATFMLVMCVYSIYFVMCSLQFTSLEEQKEGSTIIDKINQIQ